MPAAAQTVGSGLAGPGQALPAGRGAGRACAERVQRAGGAEPKGKRKARGEGGGGRGRKRSHMASRLPGDPVVGADVRLDSWPPSTDADGRVLEEQVPRRPPGPPPLCQLLPASEPEAMADCMAAR